MEGSVGGKIRGETNELPVVNPQICGWTRPKGGNSLKMLKFVAQLLALLARTRLTRTYKNDPFSVRFIPKVSYNTETIPSRVGLPVHEVSSSTLRPFLF